MRADWHFVHRWDVLAELRRLELPDASEAMLPVPHFRSDTRTRKFCNARTGYRLNVTGSYSPGVAKAVKKFLSARAAALAVWRGAGGSRA